MAKPNNLQKCREEAGLSKTDLSRLSGVSTTTIGDVERGKRETTNKTKHRLVSGLNKSNHNPREYKFEDVFP